jgi:hypothetical protein
MAQSPQQPSVVDSNNVQEIYANGLMSLNVMGSMVTLTFTNVRPDIEESLRGRPAKKLTAFVVARIAMPVERAMELRDMFNRTFGDKVAGRA